MVGDKVLTAAHCTDFVNQPIEVGFYADYSRPTETWSRTFTYAVIAREHEGTDLALLGFGDVGAVYKNAVTSPDNPYLGQFVAAIGHPVGLNYSLSLGNITAPYRSMIGDEMFEWTQADVGIAPGNSGGPLLNEYGELLGVCSFRMNSRGGGEAHLAGFVYLGAVKRFLDQHGVRHVIHP
jgi:S1-C subfamily serine protease